MIAWKLIILGSTRPIFSIYSPVDRNFFADDHSGPFFNPLRDVAMETNVRQYWLIDLHSAPWHSKTDWNITI